jgi:hypothetical protein
VIQSTDSGQNWTPILSSTTTVVQNALNNANATMGQVVLALAPATSPPAAAGIQVLYVAIAPAPPASGAPTPSDPVGLFMSTNQGATWTQCAATGIPGTTYQGYCLALAVDPASPGDGTNDVIYFGDSQQGRSTNSGASFSTLSGLHADTHAWAFSQPPAPATTVVYCGTDGGINRSTDGGATWPSLNAGGLQTTLFYNLDVKPDATASATIGALQDNRIERTASPPGWSTVVGGDGWDAVYDGTTANQLFAATNANATPQTRVERSTNDGASWTDETPWSSTGPEAGFFLASLAADPSAAGRVYATTSQNLWQRRPGSSPLWRTIGAFPAPGNGFITATVSVAPTNSNNVVVANGSQVFVSTNALAATVGGATGVAFNALPALPGRTVLRAAFDPNDPTVIYAVLGGFAGGGTPGHVFRTRIGATSWTDISPGFDVPFGALALDGADTPTTIYVGTDLGVLRSVDRGATWYVLDDLHFPRVPVTDLVIGRGSNVLRAATYGRGVFEFTRPDWPVIAVDPEAGLDFGTTCEAEYLTLDVFNVGTADLVVSSVQRLMGSTGFQVLPNPGTPLVVRPGEEITFTVRFSATTPGTAESATIRIVSNDPAAPVVDLVATGIGGTAALETVIADEGDFGEVCLDSFEDRPLVISNRGPCQLEVDDITSSDPAFVVPGVQTYPLVVAPGAAIEVPIRYQPIAPGAVTATLTVYSNDPATPATVEVEGTAPPPRLVVSIADSGDFGDTCIGSFHDLMLTLSNAGHCPLSISDIASSSGDFIVPEAIAYPLVIAPGGDLELTLRFQPTAFGPTSATITITSDDPGGPATLAVSGAAPSGTLTLTGTTDFGGVGLGQRALQTLSVCNTGKCDLHVKRVAFLPPSHCECLRRRPCSCGRRCHCGCQHREHGEESEHHHHHRCDQHCLNFTIVGNPFPATVLAGSCLGVVIEYVPTCDDAACCELVVESDDPNDPAHKLFVTGHLRRTLRSALKCWAAQELNEILEAGSC